MERESCVVVALFFLIVITHAGRTDKLELREFGRTIDSTISQYGYYYLYPTKVD
jgi:hypothetical protein